MQVTFETGDITRAQVDAIVNAANTDLLLGAGVAGAIRRVGGPSIQEECDHLGPIRLGHATISGGGNLPARFVIHAAGMHMGGGVSRDNCHHATKNSLKLAREKGLTSVAFPAIGSGFGGLDMEECASAMLAAVHEHMHEQTSLERVIFVLYEESAQRIFESAWHELIRKRP